MAQQPRDRPEPKIGGAFNVRYKQFEPVSVEFTVKHFVDDWYSTGFRFNIEGNKAVLYSITSPGDSYYVDQNAPAREKAYSAVLELPFIESVETLSDR